MLILVLQSQMKADFLNARLPVDPAHLFWFLAMRRSSAGTLALFGGWLSCVFVRNTQYVFFNPRPVLLFSRPILLFWCLPDFQTIRNESNLKEQQICPEIGIHHNQCICVIGCFTCILIVASTTYSPWVNPPPGPSDPPSNVLCNTLRTCPNIENK